MKNKIISIILSICTLLLCANSFVYALEDDVPVPKRLSGGQTASANEGYEDMYRLLSYMNLIDEELSELNMEGKVTKGFAARVIGNMSARVNENKNSEEPITYSELSEWLLKAIGSDVLASYVGYYTYAEDSGLFDGVATSEKGIPTVAEFFAVMENALNANLTDVAIIGDGVSINKNEDVTFLSKKGIILQEGIVTGLSYTTYGKNVLNDNQIEINKASFNISYKEDRDIIGKAVYAYIDIENNNVATIWENNRKNTVWDIAKEDFSDLLAGTIYALDEKDREFEIETDSDAAVFKNSVYYGNISYAEENNIFDTAHEIRVIDNDKDDIADAVFLYEYNDYVIDTVSTFSNTIVFMYGKGSLKLDGENIINITMNGEPITLDKLQAYNVATVEEATLASGKKAIDVRISQNSISGTLKGINDDEAGDYYEIDGEKYYLSDTYKDYLLNNTDEEKPKLGKTSDFYISALGKIAASKMASEYAYGYVRSIYQDELTEKYMIKMYTQSGKFERIEVAEKVKFYAQTQLGGVRLEAEDLYTTINPGVVNSIVAYKLKDGKISEFALPIDRTSDVPGSIEYPITKDYVCGTGGEASRLYMDLIYGTYYVGKTPSMEIPGVVTDKDNERMYKIKNAFAQGYGSDHYFENVTVTLYNTNKFFVPGFATVESAASGTESINTNVRSVMVADKTLGLDSDNNAVTKISYYSGGNLTTSIISADAVKIETSPDWYGTTGTMNDISRGDIIQIETNQIGEITKLKVLVNYEDLGTFRIQEGSDSAINTPVKAGTMAKAAIVYGKLIDRDGDALLVNVSNNGTDTAGGAQAAHRISNVYGQNTYTLLDTKTMKVYNSSLSELLPGDTVILKKQYSSVSDIYILR